MSLSLDIARFVVGLSEDSIPNAAAERARICILNGYGIALGALRTPYHVVATRAVLADDGVVPGAATILGDGRTTSVAGAALANGALFHGRCQEDTCGTVHAGAIIIPLLAAMVEQGQGPMERFLPALVAGYEVAGLFDLAYGVTTAPMGLRATPLYGTLGAAAAAGRMMGLDEAQMAAALSNAAGFSGGTLQSFSDGTDEWRYQVGIAAQTGLRAAQLARAGSVSAPHAFEGQAGFVRAFAHKDCDSAALRARLGTEWSILRVIFKPYPVCSFNQTPVEACLMLRDRIAGREIASVRLRMNPYETSYPGIIDKDGLTSISSTVMSAPFCTAVTLLHGVPDMARLTTFDDGAVTALVERTEVVTDASIPNLSLAIEVTTADGERIDERLERSARDFAYDRDGVAALMRRIAREEQVPEAASVRLEQFADRFPDTDISELAEIFRIARASTTETGSMRASAGGA